MKAKVTLPFLFVVALIKASVAVKCSEPFTCLTRSECLSEHKPFGGLSTKYVFRLCSQGQNIRVCCPEIPKTVEPVSTPFSTNSPLIKTEVTSSSPSTTEKIVTDPKAHQNFALLPSADKCGRNALGKLRNRPRNTDFDARPVSSDNKVIDGNEAKEGAYPWMALLFFQSNQNPMEQAWPKCGGTLVNSRYILTAAHCFDATEDRIKFVRLAEYDTRIQKCTKSSKRCPQDVKVEKIIIHELYNSSTVKNDIALLRLEENVLPTENPKIGPICLPFDTNTTVAADEKFRIAGWGKTHKRAKLGSSVLQEVIIEATGECSTCPEGSHSPLLICPLSRTEQLCVQVVKKKSPCQGDSGGPLMKEIKKNHFVQVGIVSMMPGVCGDTGVPAIYTRVDGYLIWILDNMKL